ncbi:MAG: protein kinase, partial [Holophagales bacterium]|nr:protein kinase [Holophagales bacterium]
MDAERWQRIRGIFEELSGLGPAPRGTRLRALGRDDPSLAREVESLLLRAERSGAFLAVSRPAGASGLPGLAPWPGDSDPASEKLWIERRIVGRYTLRRELGRGGMAVVYEAEDHTLDREVAVKLLPGQPQGGEWVARFHREAVLAASLDHPGIVPVFDHGADPDSGVFLVMPLVKGITLRKRLDRGALPFRHAADLGAQVAEALAFSHARGIVHRDLKPENLMLEPRGDPSPGIPPFGVRLMDFGLARMHDDARLTTVGTLLGTPAYMSPEQARGEDPGPRGDLYSLGCVLYECLVGAPPFEGDARAVLHALPHRPPVPPGSRGVVLPRALEDLVMACLAKSPDDRPATAGELAGSLRAARDGATSAGMPPLRRCGMARDGSGNRGAGPRIGAAALAVLAAALILVSSGVGRRNSAPAASPPVRAGPAAPPAQLGLVPGSPPAHPMAARRVRHTSTLLQDGRVLVAGGTTWQPYVAERLSTAELYLPAFDTWRTSPSMAEPRDLHVSVLLRDGRLLAVGGEYIGGELSGVEAFDPTAGSWSPRADLLVRRHSFTATALLDGRVLVAGGPSRAVELYDPVADSWSPAGGLSEERRNPTATRLPDGRVWLVGGRSGDRRSATTELFDPETGTWGPGPTLHQARWLHSATLLLDGRVLVVAGDDARSLTSAELYDPVLGRVENAPPIADPRNRHTATLLADGRVVVAAGNGPRGRVGSVEVYDPERNRWSRGPPLTDPRVRHTATLLPDGRVLILGGEGQEVRSSLDTAEILDLRPPPTLEAEVSMPIASGSARLFLLDDDSVLAVVAEGVGEGQAAGVGTWRLTTSGAPGGGRSEERRDADSPSTAENPWHRFGEGAATPRPEAGLIWLADGRILAAGGLDRDGRASATCAVFDPSASRWAPAAELGRARWGHTLVLLLDGRVAALGGLGREGRELAEVEVYDPAADRWRSGGSLAHPRAFHVSRLRASGEVWTAGGLDRIDGRAPRSHEAEPVGGVGRLLTELEAWDPASGASASRGNLVKGRARPAILPWNAPEHHVGHTILIGGEGEEPLASVEVCTMDWCQEMAGMSAARARHATLSLPDGRVLVAGGLTTGPSGPVPTVAVELFEPSLDVWRPGPPLSAARFGLGAVLRADGRVLLLGGTGSAGAPSAVAELLDPRPGSRRR